MGQAPLNVVVRRVTPADLTEVCRIFGWYAENSAATFEESPRTAAAWTDLSDELDGLGLPFLVADAEGEVAGYAYAGPWRRRCRLQARLVDRHAAHAARSALTQPAGFDRSKNSLISSR